MSDAMEIDAEPDPELAEMVAHADWAENQRALRERTAYHEAGHLAAAWAMEGTIYEADIIDRAPINGRAVYGIGGGEGATIGRIIAAMAGPEAQRRFAPKFYDGGVDDREGIERKLSTLCRSEDALRIVRNHCALEAARIIQDNWDAVLAVAAALLEHDYLDGDEINAVLADVQIDRANASKPARQKAWADLVARTPAPFTNLTGGIPDAA